MHWVDGTPVVSSQLLGGASASDVCLNCHARGSGQLWGSNPLLPGPQLGGGSFVFLTEGNLNDGPLGADPRNWIPGHAAGHNVIAASVGGVPDPLHQTAPGGTYSAAALGCTSCHDPHGKGGHFRLLYGSDSPPSRSNGYLFQFGTPAPEATGINLPGPAESPAHHTAYLSGVSAWCGNCHGRYHEAGSGSSFSHPPDAVLSPAVVRVYDSYRGTGYYDGKGSDSFQPLAPYEAPGTATDTTGPTPSNAKVMCLSCHRAHASSGPGSGRWDFKIGVWQEEGVNSGSYPIPNPYASTAGPGQKGLCEKCHGAGGGAPPAPDRSTPTITPVRP